MPPNEISPGTTTGADQLAKANASLGQIPPVGPHPTTGVLLVGALLWSEPAEAAAVLELVTDDDLATPSLSLVLSAVRRLVTAGTPPGPQLVLDALRREGTLKHFAAKDLEDATTSGAQPLALRSYAGAVVSEALRLGAGASPGSGRRGGSGTGQFGRRGKAAFVFLPTWENREAVHPGDGEIDLFTLMDELRNVYVEDVEDAICAAVRYRDPECGTRCNEAPQRAQPLPEPRIPIDVLAPVARDLASREQCTDRHCRDCDRPEPHTASAEELCKPGASACVVRHVQKLAGSIVSAHVCGPACAGLGLPVGPGAAPPVTRRYLSLASSRSRSFGRRRKRSPVG
jgi:hypothetical protein